MTDSLDLQREYWNREADDFNSIYSGQKSRFSLLLDRLFRRDMFQRFEFTIQNCEPIENRTYLDVGCGTGLYAIALAKKSARRVVGIDIAETMIDRCRDLAARDGVEDRCVFLQTDLLEYQPEDSFDVTIAIGLFDYIADPLPVLKKMRQVTTDKAIASFPRFWTWRAPVRKARLNLRRCPVYFFTKRGLDKLIKEAGFQRHTVTRVGKLHCVVAHSGGGQGHAD